MSDTQDVFYRLIRYIKSRPCSDCKGVFPPEVMEFDHRDHSTKTRNVGGGHLTIRRFTDELEKCDVVCANCHNIRTFKRKTHVPILTAGIDIPVSQTTTPQTIEEFMSSLRS